VATTSDGRTVVFGSTDPGRPGLWKTTDGGRPIRLSATLRRWSAVTRDDRSVVFTTVAAGGGPQSLWIVAIDGGMPTQVTNRFASCRSLSPDGKDGWIPIARRSGPPSVRDLQPARLLVAPIPAAEPERSANQVDSRRQRVPLRQRGETPQNLWIEPLDGSPPRQLTHFTDDRQITDADWSRDGKRLAIARTTTTRDIVLFKGLKP
jgi:Tol biopolymer transport system component